MQKFYGIYGRTTAIVRIEANGGKAYLECEFTRGNPNPGAHYKPATYVTSSEAEQSIIESSHYFPNLIKLIRVVNNEPVKPAVAEKTKKAVTAKEYPDVTTRNEAIEVLKSLGAKADTLADDESIKKFMTTKKVSFPNFEF